MDDPTAMFAIQIDSGMIQYCLDDGSDDKGESGFWKKNVLVKNDVYDYVRLVHEISLPLWLGVCQTGTYILNYITGESAFLVHDEGEYELIEEDFDYLCQHLGYTISNPSGDQ